MADSWERQVSLVVMLIDDMTDQVITDAARVWIEGEPAPIRKSDGYYVFTNPGKRKVLLRVQHGMYEPKVLETELPGNGETYVLRKVRLTPGRCYRLPAGTTCVEGRANPYDRIVLFSREDGGGMKLLYAYDEKNPRTISIYHPADMQLDGKLMRIEGKEYAEGESFRVVGCEGEGSYTLEKPLSHSYKKIGTTIYPMYEAKADAQGRFFLPILRLERPSMRFFCQAEGNGCIGREIVLEKAAVNRVDLLQEE